MDDSRFDALARSLTHVRSRRGLTRVLGGLASLAAASLADATARGRGDGAVRTQRKPGNPNRQFQCIAAGKRCRPDKPKSKQACKKCCESVRKVSKKKGVCCIPDGRPCDRASQCCLGSCSAGLCQNTTVRYPLLTPCNTVVDCGVQVGDVCPNVPNQCAPIQAQKGARTCGTPGSGGGAVCCRPSCGSCRDDCECCGDLRCQNGTCGAPPPCHQLGEACMDGEPCCAGAGTCNGTVCCLADEASCPCAEPGNCQGCCSGICGADGRCGSGSTCTPYGQPCSGPDECCFLQDGSRIPCVGGLCRFN